MTNKKGNNNGKYRDPSASRLRGFAASLRMTAVKRLTPSY
jgi:hypothetical protein